MKNRFLLIFLSLLLSPFCLQATHTYGGYITYKHLNSLSYEFSVHIISDQSSPAFQRNTILIDYGDQSGLDTLYRTTIFPRFTDHVTVAVYSGVHTYSNNGGFRVSVTDPNRASGIVNVTNSIGQALYLETTLSTWENNQSVLFPQTAHFFIQTDSAFEHQINLRAFDLDGDRLEYELIDSRSGNSTPLSGYQIPSNVSINSQSGTISWQTDSVGRFLFTVLIREIRNANIISQTTVDFIIESRPDIGIPPLLDFNQSFQKDSCGVNSITISPGDTILFSPIARANNNSNSTGLDIKGILSAINSASYNTISVSSDSAVGSFRWITDSMDVRCEPYFLYLRTVQANQNSPLNTQQDYVLQVYVLDSANRFCDTICNSTIISVREAQPKEIRARIYPNPASELLSIELSDYDNKDGLSLQLFDLQGKLVDEKLLEPNQSSFNYRPKQKLKGIYILSLSSKKGEAIHRKLIFDN